MFPTGWYIYAGSAMGGLDGRLGRHLRFGFSARPHWHVDWLSRIAQDKSFAVVASMTRLECELARSVASVEGAAPAAPGFGSSDCRCPAHLYRVPAAVWPDYSGLSPWAPESVD